MWNGTGEHDTSGNRATVLNLADLISQNAAGRNAKPDHQEGKDNPGSHGCHIPCRKMTRAKRRCHWRYARGCPSLHELRMHADYCEDLPWGQDDFIEVARAAPACWDD